MNPERAGDQGLPALSGRPCRRAGRPGIPPAPDPGRAGRPRAGVRASGTPFGSHFDAILEARRKEADEFYATVIPPSLNADAANVMRQALAGMLWSKQFYYYDVDKWLEERGSDPFKPTRQGRPAQRSLAPHVQRRHHLDAGQMGVSLVCGMGPGVSRSCPDAGGCGLRQAAVGADAAENYCTRTARSRHTNGTSATSIRPCMPGPRSSPTAWIRSGTEGRHRLAQGCFPETAAELHLVGQSQGPLRQERVRRRIPGSRQHRRVRPQRAAADRRLSGAGRRHGLDGAVLPEHAGNRRSSWR